MIESYKGWLFKKREHGKIVFLDLRLTDGSILQVVCKKDKLDNKTWELIEKLTQESSIEVIGELKEQPRAPGGKELVLQKLNVFHIAETPYPLAKKWHSVEALMKYRHLTIRLPKYTKIWLIREAVLKAIREYMEKEGYHEVSPPILVSSACEGGSTLFELDYFGSKAYLSQSAQLYLEALIFSLGKVWSLTPSFRAEKSRTKRHLTEYWHLEAEATWIGNKEMMDFEEGMIKFTLEKLRENDKLWNILKEFREEDIKFVQNAIEKPFEKIKYSEVISLLQEKGVKIEFGEDLGADEEALLTKMFDVPIFVTHYPKEVKAFYMKWDPEDTRVVLNHDLLAPEGYGEIIGGSERETDVNKLIERIKAEGFSPEEYSWYLDLRRYGSVQHSGFGLGTERFVRWILKLDHIRDSIPFPRMARVKNFI
ncbi:MAG: asparagine--tRNA ligase [Candidatus Aenigmarchaeota archaeon]|nr:asparagine--tRNA ligase [Candidatus Aenigmarchaeota archaeon]